MSESRRIRNESDAASSITRIGESCHLLKDSLEVIVLGISEERAKLGIRMQGSSRRTTPRLDPNSLTMAYYHSHRGVTMLVVLPMAGQRLIINDSVDLTVDELTAHGVRLSTSMISGQSTPALAHGFA
jgi:sRNA-binding carbon storage regulator CsrA